MTKRVEIYLPDNKEFLAKLNALAKSENRSRKNWMETVVIAAVNAGKKNKVKSFFS